MMTCVLCGRTETKDLGEMELIPHQTVPEVHIISGPFQDANTSPLLCIQFESLGTKNSLMNAVGIKADNPLSFKGWKATVEKHSTLRTSCTGHLLPPPLTLALESSSLGMPSGTLFCCFFF